jgi:MFS family permease
MRSQNWSLRRRDTILLLLSLLSVIASTLSPILAANTISLAIYFGRDLTDMALLTGYHLLGVGVAGFLFVPSARIWGKRHVYLLGNVLVVVSCVWGGAIGNHYGGFLWARVFQGVGLAPFEALVNGEFQGQEWRALRLSWVDANSLCRYVWYFLFRICLRRCPDSSVIGVTAVWCSAETTPSIVANRGHL